MAGAVVVGVDGSENSGRALDWAVAEAKLRGEALLIMYCLPMPIATAPMPDTLVFPQITDLKKYADGVLAAVAQTARQSAPELGVRTELAIRAPAAGLLEASTDASLVVVGTRGLDSLGAMFLGSVSTRVAANASCPTVVVPSDGGNPHHLGPIVVGVDGSDHSDAALEFALRTAALHGSELIVAYGRGPTEDLHLPEHVERAEQAQAEALIAESLDRAGVSEPNAANVTTRVVTAHPADALFEAGQNATLTVVGSRGRGGFQGMLLGSVSQSVLHRAKAPVAIVHAGQETS